MSADHPPGPAPAETRGRARPGGISGTGRQPPWWLQVATTAGVMSLLIGLLVAGSLPAGAQTGGAGTQTRAGTRIGATVTTVAPVPLEEVFTSPARFHGQLIHVQGQVSGVAGNTIFSLNEIGRSIGGEILVIAPAGISTMPGFSSGESLRPGMVVSVAGWVQRFNPTLLDQLFGLGISSGPLGNAVAGFRGQPAILAWSVQPITFRGMGDMRGTGGMDTMGRTGDMGSSMGGMSAMGGSATTEVLAEARVNALPSGPLSWVAHQMTLLPGQTITHRHEPGFVYVPEDVPTDGNRTHTIRIQGRETVIQRGETVFIGQGVEHTHVGPGTFWKIRLAPPNAGPPPNMQNARRIFASPPLEGIPQGPASILFVDVQLPAQSQTSIHTHPGSEYIYVTRGDILYENEIVGTIRLQPGDDHALPAHTAVQKRNPGSRPASFLSWFVVDPRQPFASPARF